MDYKFKKSNAEVRAIKGIQFGVISPEYIKNISVTQEMEYDGKFFESGIYNDALCDQNTGDANIGSINDPRMGAMSDPEHPGYFGHIELVRPVYHIGFLKIIIDILRSVSYYTSTVLIDKETFGSKKGKKNMLKEISRIAKTLKKCPVTGKKLPNYTKEGVKIAIDFGDSKQIISPTEVYNIFEKISDEDVEYLGMNPKYARPEWLLLKTIPVPPPHVRPSVYMSSSQKCDDDLTTKLNEIVKTNIALKNAIDKNNNDTGTSDHFISQLESLLQYNVSTFIDNQHPGQPPSLQRSGKPLKTLRERLGGKDGRVRGNLMGKRVDFSARTVITADPNLSIDQVGVPRAIAINLTKPEVVNNFNREKLMTFVKNGPDTYPGAKYIIKTGGSKMDIRYTKNITSLENGWIVERHLMDRDIILFNRQPSLHKMSIMAHYVKVLDYSTFRLNLAVCSPYNADFDGDEMNLHVPQSLTAVAEAENLMIVSKMIVSPQSNKPVMGIIQDSLLSSTKMTRRDVILNKEYVMNMIMIVDNWNGMLPKPAIIKIRNGKVKEYWTGKQMFSMILPTCLNFNRLYNLENPDDKGVLILNGNLVSGIVDKSIIGKSHGGLIHILFNDFGPGTTMVFMNQVQKIANYWIKHNGFTMGVGDAMGGKVAMKSVEEILTNMKNKIKDIINNKDVSNPRLLEEMINNELNSATSQAGKKAQESLTFENNFNAAVTSGSKGSSINISQIMACVGQQNVEGRRIPYSFKYRSLPHFSKHDIGQTSRGFVENSYIKGLTPTEFFFHSMAGREGLIDTACKTSETGYIQRRLVKALEDVSVKYDNTVRNSKGLIVQFLYGEDGIDATFMESVEIELLKKNKKELIDEYDNGIPEEFDFVKKCQEDLLNIAKSRGLNNSRLEDCYFPLSVNIQRILMYASKNIKTNEASLSPELIYDLVKGLCQRIQRIFSPDIDFEIKYSEKDRATNACRLMTIYIMSCMASKKIKYLNKPQLIYAIEEIEIKYRRSIAAAGEMCGIVAAQSIGEPATQMSCHGNTLITVLTPDNIIYRGKVSTFMDLFFDTERNMKSQIVDVNGYKIIGVSESEKTSWKEISQLSRHPANGKLVKVVTRSGKSTIATLSHSFLKRTTNKIVPVLGSDLKTGDRIPVAKYIPIVENPLYETEQYKLTKEFGWFIGAYLADGNINYNEISISKIIPEFSKKIIEFAESLGTTAKYTEKEKRHNTFGPEGKTKFINEKLSIFLKKHFGEGSESKKIGSFVYQSNLDFVSGIISGYFDGDGNVNSMIGKQMIRSSSISEQLTIDMIYLLSYFGIFASKCIEKKKNHTIQVSRKYAKIFKEKIGLIVLKKNKALDEIIQYIERPDAPTQDLIDKIPELGPILKSVGTKLKHVCKNHSNSKSVGRSTLIKYINDFEKHKDKHIISEELNTLKQAAYSDVVWDEIMSLEILDDPNEYVYDFTVPGNQSFMVDCGVLVHNTLNTFHYAGVSAKNVTLGVPRLKELINVTKSLKTPSLTMYDSGNVTNIPESGQKRIVETVRSNLEYKTLQDIIQSSDIIGSDSKEFVSDNETVEFYKKLYSFDIVSIPSEYKCLRFSFFAKDLEYVDINMISIAKLIHDQLGEPNIKIICSDDNDSNLFIRIVVISDDIQFVNETLRKIEIHCMTIKLKGVEGVERVYTRESKISKWDSVLGHHKEKQWIFETEGTNLLGSMEIEGIDHTRTISNDTLEIYDIFGIEAARQSLLNELVAVLSFDGSYVNYRHLDILVDTMTCRGSMNAVTRHGINRNIDVGALTKCSFEETVEILTDAAAFSELDTLKGISDNIMLGQLIPAGTGVIDVLYDQDMKPDIIEEIIVEVPIVYKFIPSEPMYDLLAVF